MWAYVIHGPELITVMQRLSMFRSIGHFTAGAGALNMISKRMPAKIDQRLTYAELGNLTGYRMPPMPGFDIINETRELAEGGAEHGIYGWKNEFQELMEEITAGQKINRVEFMTLEQYIANDAAATAGASSVGKVHYTFDGKEHKFKARKNFLLDILSAEQIYGLVERNAHRQEARAFVKPELGKMRVAVTGDLESYLVTSWLNYLAGHCYTSWEGSTLEEDRWRQMERMDRMIRQLIERFSLPFDYKGFDHQPELWEVKAMCRHFFSAVFVNVPLEYQSYVQEWIDIAVESFDESTCVLIDQQRRYEFDVTGGVQSGIRLTSLLGNFWNQIMTKAARKFQPRAKAIEDAYLRGDDSSLVCDSYQTCLLARLAYAAINAVGQDPKYGIHYQQSEFLRIWYTSERVYGYVNRAIPSLSQRKPWTSDPWDPDAVVLAQISTLNIIERRTGQTFARIRRRIEDVWAKKRKVPVELLAIPRSRGGLGVYAWTGAVINVQYPSGERVEVDFTTSPGSEERYVRKFEKLVKTDVVLSNKDLKQIQQQEMNRKSSADDLPEIARYNRQKFKDNMASLGKIEVSYESVVPLTTISRLALQLEYLRRLETIEDLKRIEFGAMTFGQFRDTEEYVRALQELSQWQSINFWTEIAKYSPQFEVAVRAWEKKGMHRTMAMDFLFGKLEAPSSTELHDAAATSVTYVVGILIDQNKIEIGKMPPHHWIYLIQHLVSYARRYISTSPLVERLLKY